MKIESTINENLIGWFVVSDGGVFYAVTRRGPKGGWISNRREAFEKGYARRTVKEYRTLKGAVNFTDKQSRI